MMQTDIRELNERIRLESSFIDVLSLEMNKVIVGQKHMTESLMIGLLSNGHILLEGVPGLAKTLAITTLAKAVDGKFARIQFTPDLLPADLLGTMIYSQKKEEFQIKKGPIFANFVLADEINRSPAKVQSALLEAFTNGCMCRPPLSFQSRVRGSVAGGTSRPWPGQLGRCPEVIILK